MQTRVLKSKHTTKETIIMIITTTAAAPAKAATSTTLYETTTTTAPLLYVWNIYYIVFIHITYVYMIALVKTFHSLTPKNCFFFVSSLFLFCSVSSDIDNFQSSFNRLTVHNV